MKNKSYINTTEPNIPIGANKYISQVFKNKKFTDGEFQKKCEDFIKKRIKANFVALTQNCTSALEISAILINIKEGDEVILPSFTFTSTANAFVLRGAKILFADIDLKNLCIDIKHVKKLISKKTKAVVVVHYGPYSCDLDELSLILKKKNIFLIEDAAHSFDSKYKKKYLGTWGDIGTFSFHETKNFNGGQCGALIINNKKLLHKINYILDKGTDRLDFYKKINIKKSFYNWMYVGSEYRATELSAALLYSQFILINKINFTRRKLWNNYYKLLNINSNNKFKILPISKYLDSSFHNFVILFFSKKLKLLFIRFMKKNNINCTTHYYPLHLSPYGRQISKFRALPNTSKLFNTLVRLPLYNGLKKNDQKKIIDCIKKFLI
jgi:dTDP-4-amino-4,6-dideoxygalactose transaminase